MPLRAPGCASALHPLLRNVAGRSTRLAADSVAWVGGEVPFCTKVIRSQSILEVVLRLAPLAFLVASVALSVTVVLSVMLSL